MPSWFSPPSSGGVFNFTRRCFVTIVFSLPPGPSLFHQITVHIWVAVNLWVLHLMGAGSCVFLYPWSKSDPCRTRFGCGFHFSPVGVTETRKNLKPEKTQNPKKTRIRILNSTRLYFFTGQIFDQSYPNPLSSLLRCTSHSRWTWAGRATRWPPATTPGLPWTHTTSSPRSCARS
jgi:hypothetical protein